jgi:hypothetical protein
MAGTDLSFDIRYLPAATLDSFGRLSLSSEFLKCPTIGVEFGFLAAECLPTLHDHVYVLRVQLEPKANTLGQFRGRQRRATSQERIVRRWNAHAGLTDRLWQE